MARSVRRTEEEAAREFEKFVGSLSDDGVTGRMKKVMQSEEVRKGMLEVLQKGVRLDLMIEASYDRSADGKLTMKPEVAEIMKDMLPP
jgi:hypothetical protein